MINVVLTGLLVLVTGIYAWFTYRILRSHEATLHQMREQQENTIRPYVVVSTFITAGSDVFLLSIKNTGITPARNLRLTIDRNFYQFGQTADGKTNLKCFPAFNQSIASFAPGAEMVFKLAPRAMILGPSAASSVTPAQFNVTAVYDFLGKQVTETSMIDLLPFRESLGTAQIP
jgi:hypothetical protein